MAFGPGNSSCPAPPRSELHRVRPTSTWDNLEASRSGGGLQPPKGCVCGEVGHLNEVRLSGIAVHRGRPRGCGTGRQGCQCRTDRQRFPLAVPFARACGSSRGRLRRGRSGPLDDAVGLGLVGDSTRRRRSCHSRRTRPGPVPIDGNGRGHARCCVRSREYRRPDLRPDRREADVSKEQAGSPVEGASSPVLKLMASRLEELAFFFRVLADPDQGVEPGDFAKAGCAPPGADGQGPDECWEQRRQVLEGCYAERTHSWRYCYARATIAEANCIKHKEAERSR